MIPLHHKITKLFDDMSLLTRWRSQKATIANKIPRPQLLMMKYSSLLLSDYLRFDAIDVDNVHSVGKMSNLYLVSSFANIC